ncbi:monovalent cation/H+ antiporter complex subunit F [Jannaschia seosinensis]|nr:MrpF/PhaF family protein [Jannaschia seosinensis]
MAVVPALIGFIATVAFARFTERASRLPRPKTRDNMEDKG